MDAQPNAEPQRSEMGHRARIGFWSVAIASLFLLCAPLMSAQSIAFQSPITLQVPSGDTTATPVGVVIADVNGDGILDIVSLNRGSSSVSVFLGRSDGTYAGAISTLLAAGPQAFVTGDFNRDGKADLAISFVSSPGIQIMLSHGDGTYDTGPMAVTSGSSYALAVGDFNADGLTDVAGVDPINNRLVVVLGQLDGSFSFPKTYATAAGPSSVQATDVDLDGNVDIVVANQTAGSASLFKNDGKANFAEVTAFRQSVNTPGASSLVNVDVNNDGFDDLMIVDSGNFALLLNRPDAPGNFNAQSNFAIQGTVNGSVVTTDIDGDGIPDFLVPTSNNRIQIYLGATLSAPPSTLSTDTGPQAIAIADLNSDGKMDIVVANSGSNTILIYLNQSPDRIRPQTGWWWDPALNGTGFFIETGGVSGNGLFIGGFLYDASGNSTWLVSTGQMKALSYSNNWLTVTGGQTLTGPYQPPTAQLPTGAIKLTFVDANHALLARPNTTTLKLHRFSFTASASPVPPQPGSPQIGWWWAGASKSGTGYGIEIQGTSVFIVAYVYDGAGNPIWYLATGNMSSPSTYSGTWLIYNGGPQLSSREGKYAAVPLSAGATAMTLTFSDPTHATLTMGNTVIPLVRFLQY